MNTDFSPEHLKTVKLCAIHPDIPQSLFLENIRNISSEQNGEDTQTTDELLRHAKLVAFKLYEKYIKIGSELEINISSLLRQELKNILSNEEHLMNKININFTFRLPQTM